MCVGGARHFASGLLPSAAAIGKLTRRLGRSGGVVVRCVVYYTRRSGAVFRDGGGVYNTTTRRRRWEYSAPANGSCVANFVQIDGNPVDLFRSCFIYNIRVARTPPSSVPRDCIASSSSLLLLQRTRRYNNNMCAGLSTCTDIVIIYYFIVIAVSS